MHNTRSLPQTSANGCECLTYGCSKPRKARGFCYKHYGRLRRDGVFPSPPCSICGEPSEARSLCHKHYRSEDLSKHPRCKAKGYATSAGYRQLYRKGTVVLEHRIVMERTLSRELQEGENVHHKNGVRDDNRPESLELWVTYQPKGQRPDDLCDWAEQILFRYRPDSLAKD
jgi:hypothetical protein